MEINVVELKPIPIICPQTSIYPANCAFEHMCVCVCMVYIVYTYIRNFHLQIIVPVNFEMKNNDQFGNMDRFNNKPSSDRWICCPQMPTYIELDSVFSLAISRKWSTGRMNLCLSMHAFICRRNTLGYTWRVDDDLRKFTIVVYIWNFLIMLIAFHSSMHIHVIYIDIQEQYQIKNICLSAIIELLLSCKMYGQVGERINGKFHHIPRTARIKADSIRYVIPT